MANIRGIELASEIYDLEDTSARNTAASANAKATENETAISEVQGDVESLSESALTPKLLANIQIALASGYSADSAVIQNLTQVGRVITGTISIYGLAGPNVGTSSTIVIGTCSLRPLATTFAIGMDYLSSTIVRGSIGIEGNVILNETTNMPTPNNKIEVPFTIII